MTLQNFLQGVLTLAFHLLLTSFNTGSADEALVVGLKNTSSGVLVSLVPSNHSLSSPLSLLVADRFVPPACGPRSFRCGNPIVVLPTTNVSGSSPSSMVQYIILAPVIRAVLIMDWRLSSMKMNLSSYVVKRVVGNECDPLAFIQSTTGSIYMVCVKTFAVFLYTINLNTTSINSTTIPGYLSQYVYYLSQPLLLLSNFVYNGETLVYFLDGSSLHSFDLSLCRLTPRWITAFPASSFKSTVNVGMCEGTCPESAKACIATNKKTVAVSGPNGVIAVEQTVECGCRDNKCYREDYYESYWEVVNSSEGAVVKEKVINVGRCKGDCNGIFTPKICLPTPERCVVSFGGSRACCNPATRVENFVGLEGQSMSVVTVTSCNCL